MVTADQFLTLSTALVEAFAPNITLDSFTYDTEFMDGYYENYEDCPGLTLAFGSKTDLQVVYVELLAVSVDENKTKNWRRTLEMLELTELSSNQLTRSTVERSMKINDVLTLNRNYGTLYAGVNGLLEMELVVREGELTRLWVGHSKLIQTNAVHDSD